jgi:hypothetical protein
MGAWRTAMEQSDDALVTLHTIAERTRTVR